MPSPRRGTHGLPFRAYTIFVLEQQNTSQRTKLVRTWLNNSVTVRWTEQKKLCYLVPKGHSLKLLFLVCLFVVFFPLFSSAKECQTLFLYTAVQCRHSQTDKALSHRPHHFLQAADCDVILSGFSHICIHILLALIQRIPPP